LGFFSRAFGGYARGPGDADRAARSALLRVLEGDLERAEADLVAAARRGDDPETHLALARLLRLRGDVGRALRIHQNLLLRPGLEPGPRRAALLGLAEDLRQGGYRERAIAAFEEALAGEPSGRVALRALSALYLEAGRYDDAARAARRLARAEGRRAGPAEAEVRIAEGAAARDAGRMDDARRAARRAVRCDRRSAAAWLLRGDAESARGKARAAVSAWRRAALVAEAPGDALERLRGAWTREGRAGAFEALLEKLLEARPGRSDLLLLRARERATRGRADEAVADIRRALEVDPASRPAHGLRFRVLRGAGRDAEALAEGELLADLADPRPGAEGGTA